MLASLFIFQFILSCIDLIAIALSPIYQNVIGNIKNHSDLIFRIAPSVYVFMACAICLYLYRNLTKYSKISIYVFITIFAIFTILSFIPWIGLYSVLLTPVCSLYYGIMFFVSSQHAYTTILIMLGLYLFQNTLILVKLKNE